MRAGSGCVVLVLMVVVVWRWPSLEGSVASRRGVVL